MLHEIGCAIVSQEVPAGFLTLNRSTFRMHFQAHVAMKDPRSSDFGFSVPALSSFIIVEVINRE